MKWPMLPQSPGQRIPLLLFVASAMAAIAVGFALVRPQQVGPLIIHGGYYYVLTVFGLWVFYAWRCFALRRQSLPHGWRGVALFLLGATAFSVWTDAFAHKVLFDEYVLQASAWHMHLT